MKNTMFLMVILLCFGPAAYGAEGNLSEETETCLECHRYINPGITEGWERSRMSRTSPSAAMEMDILKRRISTENIPRELAEVVVGCAECHTLNPGEHKDTFEHNGFKVHTVVTPKDCATCHPKEASEYKDNIMSHAHGNLQNNPLYKSLADSINGIQVFKNMETFQSPPDRNTEEDSCLYCHGTAVTVKGRVSRQTDFGEMEFPVLSGWPNRGVGRINPDGSQGSCTACHPRHGFRVEVARKPYTCSECHKGPDVPAYKIYSVSKHGNIHSSVGKEWNFNAVPWTVGKDFSAPTCAACHISLLVSRGGEIVSQRTHRMNDRIPWRLFGLIYAHAHPRSPDTADIVNRAGLNLPTELTGEPVTDFLIDEKEQRKRQDNMESVCIACHSRSWVTGHFNRLENSIRTTNKMTLTATNILMTAWEKGVAKGPAEKDSPFNEGIEKKWVEQWLFYANSTRLASAMAGADYGVFANGRWYMTRNIQDMLDWLKMRSRKKD